MQDIYPSRFAAEAEMRSRQDPVVHSQWSPDAPVSAAQAERFERDGYLVLEDIFSADEVAFLQQAAGTLLADPARLAADSRLADVARFLLGDEVYIHQSRLNYKPGFKGREFYWHSDFETWHVEDGMPRMRALSMSILLAENTPNNGPLMVIPGSHKTYLTCVGETPEDHYLSSLKKQEYGVPDEMSLAELANKHGIVAPMGKPGTVILFDCNLMHGSNGNITPFPRANAFLVYNAVSNRLEKPFGVEKPRPWFLANRNVPQALQVQHGRLAEAVAA